MTATKTQESLIQWLYGRAEAQDRATLAALRRGLLLEPAQFFQLYSVIPSGLLAVSREEVERRLVVAILFASHWEDRFSGEQLAERPHNLGESLRTLAMRKADAATPSDQLLPDALKRRMDAILAAPADEVYGHLRHLIGLLRSEGVPVDWNQLLWDLRRWSDPDRPVQWWWSRSFYVGHRETSEGGVDHVS